MFHFFIYFFSYRLKSNPLEDGEEDSLSILAIPGKNTSQSTDQITPDEILSPALQVF